MRDLEAGDELDGYELTAVLAQGGMATVFHARDRRSGAEVAIKVPLLRYECDPVFHERFAREEALGLQLAHPNLVKVLPPAREKSRVYLVMEYVEGATLATRLAPGSPLPAPEVLALARPLCDALGYLHGQGIAHLDVKPSNVLVGAGGEVKLLDLGIARARALRRISWPWLSTSVGTPAYMAPEQAHGRGEAPAADVYALGTLLYQAVTGHLPFELEDGGALLRAKRRQPPPPPDARVPGLDRALAAGLLRAIDRDPARRPSVTELLAEISGAPPRAAAPVSAAALRSGQPASPAALPLTSP